MKNLIKTKPRTNFSSRVYFLSFYLCLRESSFITFPLCLHNVILSSAVFQYSFLLFILFTIPDYADKDNGLSLELQAIRGKYDFMVPVVGLLQWKLQKLQSTGTQQRSIQDIYDYTQWNNKHKLHNRSGLIKFVYCHMNVWSATLCTDFHATCNKKP